MSGRACYNCGGSEMVFPFASRISLPTCRALFFPLIFFSDPSVLWEGTRLTRHNCYYLSSLSLYIHSGDVYQPVVDDDFFCKRIKTQLSFDLTLMESCPFRVVPLDLRFVNDLSRSPSCRLP